ncbi:galactose-1-phosphate uridylyltransferase [Candidatus Azambacteria bacterium]|nr:galactose-1-phosphate uridylyltransferase [Candidatus Azambacteria bacterium]
MKKPHGKHPVPVSQLRQDIVSGDWIVVATSRAKRAGAFIQERRETPDPKPTCPFENPQAAGNPEPLLWFGETRKDWTLQVIPNKYPAFGPGNCKARKGEGPYIEMDGSGFHEVIITRDHEKSLAEFSQAPAIEVLKAYRDRYRALMNEPCVRYIFIFHNHGRESGATISHPHSQLVAMPVIPGDVARSLGGAERYFSEKGSCVHCAMIDWERRRKARVIFENRSYIAYAPYASRTVFEVRVFPKKHEPRFEETSDQALPLLADALRLTLKKISAALKNPAYNFFIHTAPAENPEEYPYYHWHIEILPKITVWGAVEIGTGIEIITISPEDAAAFLRTGRA